MRQTVCSTCSRGCDGMHGLVYLEEYIAGVRECPEWEEKDEPEIFE